MKLIWIISAVIVLNILPAVAMAQGEAPPTCEDAYLDAAKKPDVRIDPADIEAMCDPANAKSLFTQVAKSCPKASASFTAAYANVCGIRPQVGGNADTDRMARVYLAVKPQLIRTTPARGLAPAKAEGIGATEVAQGIGGFLVSRAEQEVSAYATAELFSRLCKSDMKTLLPNTCGLLETQDNGAAPVGLGLLQRAILKDLAQAPEQALLMAMEAAKKKKDTSAQNAVCSVDVAHAFLRAILAGESVDPTLPTKAKGYAVFQGDDCKAIWDGLAWGALVGQQVEKLAGDLVELRAAQQAGDRMRLKAARTEVVRQSAVVFNSVDKNADSTLLKELGDLITAAWNEQWLDLVDALASAKTLGHRTFCNVAANESCAAFDKTSIVLGIVGDIAAAKDSAGVQATLERVAQPVGTWRRKFEDNVTFNLNGYAGVKVAYEGVEGDAPSGKALAPVLALGLDLSFPVGPGHLGVFGQVVDVGNVASVHFRGSTDSALLKVQAEPNIGFPQLFAPGGYVVWAPFKSPFVIGAGGDWVPELRKTADGRQHSVWHVGAMLSVDVPILELCHQ